ncbi:hypothetical protein SAMN06269185_1661 [Natronoarchaeum philippinense]|uniref:Uncharacterized protein n=1 Tax=Natronoarchaeum philippinense TaxID=558529 RepID=A0A285NSC5_NATPI|nr:hypothetical protein SAMN06269185_1661 [Natronoarchaeum philippinense]
MTIEYLCPQCFTRAVTADVHQYECEACGQSWDSLRELAETKPKTEMEQQTLASVASPGDAE